MPHTGAQPSLPPPVQSRDATAPPIHVLVIDDDAALRRTLARVLVKQGFRVDTAEGASAALSFLRTHDPDVALCDLRMPDMNGIELLPRLKAARPELMVIMMTAFAEIDDAVAAVKGGAHQFLTKPFQSNDVVLLSVKKAAEHRRLVEKARRLEHELEVQGRAGEMVGDSPKMRALYRIIESVAPTSSTVLVLGESGTGKELVARAVHERSPRAAMPFVAVNCAAIAKELVESELFGHVKGSFTGAVGARAGLFETANGGTLFLDEVADLPLPAQVKLLRALQEGEIKRVGSDETRTVDVRIIAATNVDLAAKLADGTFRRDLFYRLNVISIALPALRERSGDVGLLAQFFLEQIARRMGRKGKRLSEEATRLLRKYAWPGNVRELENAMERAFILARDEVLQPSDFAFLLPADDEARDTTPAEAPHAPSNALELRDLPYAEAKRRALELFEDDYVRDLLQRSGGNTSEAARQAGMDRSNFRRILRRIQR